MAKKIGWLLFSIILIVSGSVTSALAVEFGEAMDEEILRPWTGDLDGMKSRRTIRVLVPISQTFCFVDKGKLQGLAVEALAEFEKQLNSGLDLKRHTERIVVKILPTTRDKLLPFLVEGRGDLVVANLTITKERLESVDFSDPVYDNASEVVITPASSTDITTQADLAGLEIHVRRSSSYYQSLLEANNKPELKKSPIRIVEADETLEDEELLEMVNAELIPATVVDSHKFAFWNQIFDNIKAAKAAPVRTNGKIGWAMRKNSPQLHAAVNSFIDNYRKGSLLGNMLFKRYLKNTKWLIRLRSPQYQTKAKELRTIFETYGAKYNIDWRLIAAMAFQESRFNPSLKSRTGAMGLMQIKPSTARDRNIGIKNISTPDANVHAGVKYLRFLADRYFDDNSIDEKNRIFMALAAYNAGPNRITELRANAANPNIWFDEVENVVAENVGMEPVHYVSNIYRYYLVFSRLYPITYRN